MPEDALDRFSPPTRSWFRASFHAPTAAQERAWQSIAEGENTLVVAPTGSGKTLAAFLWGIDNLINRPEPESPLQRCRLIYVSPLKALAADIQRNLRSPLVGVRHAAAREGVPLRDIQVAMRTGDTTPAQRRRLAAAPPDVLITTPESLYLLLTSRAREGLASVESVIVDEVHAMCTTKRGAHLALSLERLDMLLEQPAQRIGLSATVRPTAEIATFLGGARPVRVVEPGAGKRIDMRVVVPVPDMSNLSVGQEGKRDTAAPTEQASIWPAVESRIVDLIEAHGSTIVFANSRRLAERLCSRINEEATNRAAARAAAPPTSAGSPEDVLSSGDDTPPEGPPRDPGENAPVQVARAHHGSVSREERKEIEESLKSGRLPAVVATSSLELGIDMGAVDLVVQVEPPPSVSSGTQRVGRAGHQVEAVSRGVMFPRHRGDLLPSAVTADRMARGQIEHMRYPRNPLDVLAQQVVAMVAMDEWTVGELAAVVRRAAPFSSLPDTAFHSVLDMLSGRYPSDSFAELRPRLVWNRVQDTLSARKGAQRLAVTNAGTIPDRGLFGVFLAGASDEGARVRRRVGELDEEMVYESRVGDVFLLGSSSWRIEDITPDRVLVSPAPGEPGRMPFWHGDSPGRPLELGRAIGGFVRELGTLSEDRAAGRLSESGLDEWATENVLAYLTEQREATGAVPDDRTIVVERFRDELGDWRYALHCPFGAQVTAPWALAVSTHLTAAYGIDVQAMHHDDGIVIRIPDMPDPPAADQLLPDPDTVEHLVTGHLHDSALFAARFRECAGRSLLLPRRDPGRRSPLWQQRQRAASLLQVASDFPNFPVVLEAVRECLQDVFDMAGLVEVLRGIRDGEVSVVAVDTPRPSPFARTLLFSYVGMFLYEGDAPLAERRAQALSIDTSVLAELLGRTDLREILDEDVLATVERELQGLTGHRTATDAESTWDLLRSVGDLTTDEVVDRGGTPAWLAALAADRRAVRVRVAGEERWAAVEDAARLRDGLGVPLPVGVPHQMLEPVEDPLGDLVGRYARTHGPFPAAACATRLGLPPAVVTATLARLETAGRVTRGEFRPHGHGTEWVDVTVMGVVRRRSLALLRESVEPVTHAAYARFLPTWQGVGSATRRGYDGLLRTVHQLQGCPLPASALETLVLPSRVAGYSAAMLDELTAAGDVLWAGAGALPGRDGTVVLCTAEDADLLLPDPTTTSSAIHAAILASLRNDEALFYRSLYERVEQRLAAADDAADVLLDADLVDGIWDLVWAGWLTNDTLGPLRAYLGGRAKARSGSAGRFGRPRPVLASHRPARDPTRTSPARRSGPPHGAGRWSMLPVRGDATHRALARAETLLDRYGIVTSGPVEAETVPGGYSGVYKVLRRLEDGGRCRRGYYIEGLGAAQFAASGAADRLRASGTEDGEPQTLVLPAADPANPFGAALPWPVPPATGLDGEEAVPGHRPGRKAGAHVVITDGVLSLFLERGGRSTLTFTQDIDLLSAACEAVALAVRSGRLHALTVERVNGAEIDEGAPVFDALVRAGFQRTPRGLRLRG